MHKAKVKETEVFVTLSYASMAAFNKKAYNFTKAQVQTKELVKVNIKDLSFKSNVKVTRICLNCAKEAKMTLHKANMSPICHKCITNTSEFKYKTSIGTQEGRVRKGDKAQYRTIYKNKYGDIPKNWDIHHINMDETDNSLENLIALPRSQHKISHGTLNRLCKDLLKSGFIVFDFKDFTYKFSDAFHTIDLIK